MFNVDKELDEIRSINVTPSDALLTKIKDAILYQEDELTIKRKQKQKRFAKIAGFGMLPAAVAAACLMLIFISLSRPVAYYSLDINPNIILTVDKHGIVSDIEYTNSDILDNILKDDIVGVEIEMAISQAVALAQHEGYISQDENILIGCFGDDEYNNISKNLTLSYLDKTLSNDINLMSVHGSISDWKAAEKAGVSPGLYELSILADVDITSDTTLDMLVSTSETKENRDISLLLDENKEPIIYKAPKLSYTTDGEYAVLKWDYIDYKNINYDGEITYQLVSASSTSELFDKPTIIDEYTFSSWGKQPVDYTLKLDDNSKNKYYGIITIYDDGRRIIDKDVLFLP